MAHSTPAPGASTPGGDTSVPLTRRQRREQEPLTRRERREQEELKARQYDGEKPLTRRERREREQAAEALPSRRELRATEPVAVVADVDPELPLFHPPLDAAPAPVVDFDPMRPMVPAVDATVKELPAAPLRTRRATPSSDVARGRKKRGRVRRGMSAAAVSVAAMGFVALVTIVTTTPAASLLSSSDVQAMALDASTTTSLTSEPKQQVEVDDNVTELTLSHDGYATETLQEAASAAGIRAESTFINNPTAAIQWPFKVGVHIGDQFGYRNCAGCSSNHGGQDFNPGDGAEIQAIADGVVSIADNGGGSLGVYMAIDHVIDEKTVTSVYAHMQTGTMRFQVGDTVEVGDVIGNTGTTGMSTGPHLHFEIREGGVNGTKVDPLQWLWANAGRETR